jgi:hypothetical protein
LLKLNWLPSVAAVRKDWPGSAIIQPPTQLGAVIGLVAMSVAGGTVGAGVEYGFAPNLSAKLEYRYIAAALELSHINEVLVGVNYRFGGN